MATGDKKNKDKEQLKILRELAQSLGLGSLFSELIRNAVVQDWSQGEFLTALVSSDVFQAKFPGLLDRDGNLQDFLTGQEQASLSAANLGSAIRNYKSLWDSYQQAAKGYRDITGKIGKDKLAALIRAEKSPDEFRANLQAIKVVSQNDRSFQMFNQQRRLAGLKPLKRSELYRAISTRDKEFIDIYEATRLQFLGQGLLGGASGAAAVARALPNVDVQGRETGATPDQRVAELVEELAGHLSDVGPELRRAGIDNIALARYLANPATNPRVANRLKQLIATKRSRGAYVAGTQGRKGPAGGLALYEEEGAASY